jgi:DamX protein
MLVVALQSGGWHCTQVDELWRCEPAVKSRPAPPEAASSDAAVLAPSRAEAASPGPAADQSALAVDSELVEELPSPAVDSEVAEEPFSPTAAQAYVVQVGAYRTKEKAQAAARSINGDRLVVLPTVKGGQDWFVLLLGAFPTLAEARAAGDAYRRNVPGASYWVRSAEDLRRVLKSEAD